MIFVIQMLQFKDFKVITILGIKSKSLEDPAEDIIHVTSRPSAFVAKAWQPDPRWREVLCEDFVRGHCAQGDKCMGFHGKEGPFQSHP